jgi:hypothetical protein
MALQAERDFRDILAAACLSPCSVPFSCPSQALENLDGTRVVLEIVDGQGAAHPADSEPADPPPPVGYDHQVSVEDGQLISGAVDDDPFSDDLAAIWAYFQENLGLLFNSQVISLQLQFGVIDDSRLVHLLDGSGATAVNGFTLNLFSEIPGASRS